MKKNKLVFGLVISILIFVIIFIFLRGDEDTWIKDSKGVYVEHGVPSEVSDEVKVQQDAVIGAMQLYQKKKMEGMQFNSQCLGNVGDSVVYAVDIVNIPRSEEDNLDENQCDDFKMGRVGHFIELDGEGNIVRIV